MEMGRRRRRRAMEIDRGRGLLPILRTLVLVKRYMRRWTVRRLKLWLYPESAAWSSLSSIIPLPSRSAAWKQATTLGSVPGGNADGTSDANGLPYPPAGPYAAAGGGAP
jgi:hypothetical protein